jgi:general secretion pathway protein F
MPVFEYKALNSAGETEAGLIEANDFRTARSTLREKGLFPTELTEASPAQEFSPRFSLIGRGRDEELAMVTRQLSILLDAGLPIPKAISILGEQLGDGKMKRVILSVSEEIKGGGPLSDALSRHPKVFSNLYVSLVRTGESSGALEEVLNRLADLKEREWALKNRIRAILSYPIFMAVIGVGVISFLLTFVIPRVTELFRDMEAVLPLPTVLLIWISGSLERFWWLFLIVGLGFLAGGRLYIGSEKGRRVFDKFKLRTPLIGNLLLKVDIVRFTRTLGMLLAGGVPLVKSMGLVKDVLNNRILSSAVEASSISISHGERVADPMKRSGLFPPALIHMLRVGEESGKLEEVLSKISRAYEDQVQSEVMALTSLLEPVIILIMGGIIGFVVVAILLPIFEMSRIIR